MSLSSVFFARMGFGASRPDPPSQSETRTSLQQHSFQHIANDPQFAQRQQALSRAQQEQQRVSQMYQQRQQGLQQQRQHQHEQQVARQRELARLTLKEAVERAMRKTLEDSVDEVGFERSFKKQLEFFASHATVKRQGDGKFEVSAPGQKPVFASLRLDAAPEILQEFRSLAPIVKKTLLGNSADWLKRLGRGGESIDGFLAAVEVARDTPIEQREGDRAKDLCSNCGVSLRKDCLAGGGHHCRMLVTFKCPQCRKTWTTQRGRFSIKEKRILGHDCASCKHPGEVVKSEILTVNALHALSQKREAAERARQKQWRKDGKDSSWWQGGKGSWQSSSERDKWQQNSDWGSSSWSEEWQELDATQYGEYLEPRGQQPKVMFGQVSVWDDSVDQAGAPRIATEQHRSDLCEGCKRYGDCSGFFIEPFQVFAIAKLLLSREDADYSDDDSLEWREADGTVELAGFRSGSLRLLPHIYEEGAVISQHEAARISNAQRQAFMRERGLPSTSSSSQSVSDLSSGSRTIRSSEDRAMRQRFQGR